MVGIGFETFSFHARFPRQYGGTSVLEKISSSGWVQRVFHSNLFYGSVGWKQGRGRAGRMRQRRLIPNSEKTRRGENVIQPQPSCRFEVGNSERGRWRWLLLQCTALLQVKLVEISSGFHGHHFLFCCALSVRPGDPNSRTNTKNDTHATHISFQQACSQSSTGGKRHDIGNSMSVLTSEKVWYVEGSACV